eukprot:15481539-Alexandrium_andersonii.AAC.1
MWPWPAVHARLGLPVPDTGQCTHVARTCPHMCTVLAPWVAAARARTQTQRKPHVARATAFAGNLSAASAAWWSQRWRRP